jgi:hypothetical protein
MMVGEKSLEASDMQNCDVTLMWLGKVRYLVTLFTFALGGESFILCGDGCGLKKVFGTTCCVEG